MMLVDAFSLLVHKYDSTSETTKTKKIRGLGGNKHFVQGLNTGFVFQCFVTLQENRLLLMLWMSMYCGC